MSQNDQEKQGMQQTKEGSLNRLTGIHQELRRIQQQQQGQQLRTIPPGRRRQQQDDTVSPSITTDTEPYTDTSPQSINPRNQRRFFPPFESTSSTSVVNQQGGNYLYPDVNRGRSLGQLGSASFGPRSSTSIDNQQGGNYLYPGSNRGRSLRQQGSASFEPTSSTSVGNRQEPYDYFNDPTITQEVREIRREARNIRQARVREENPNLDLKKWRQDDEARMRRHSLNTRNRRLENAPKRPRGLTPSTSFENNLGPTSRRGLFLGGRYAPDMSSLVMPNHFATGSSTSSANDSALLNGPDQNVAPPRRYSVTSNIPIGDPAPRVNAPATRGEKRGIQQQLDQRRQPPTKKFTRRDP